MASIRRKTARDVFGDNVLGDLAEFLGFDSPDVSGLLTPLGVVRQAGTPGLRAVTQALRGRPTLIREGDLPEMTVGKLQELLERVPDPLPAEDRVVPAIEQFLRR